MPNYTYETDYEIQLDYIINFTIDCCLFADLIESNVVPYTLSQIKAFATKRDKKLLQYFNKINVEYFFKFNLVSDYDGAIGQKKLVWQYATLESPSEYFYVYMPSENLNFFIEKYNIQEKI